MTTETGTQEVEVGTEASSQMSDDKGREYMLRVAKVTQQAFKSLAQLEPEEVLMAFEKPVDAKAYIEVVGIMFSDTIEAELPSVFNQHLQKMSMTLCERAFAEVNAKTEDNVTALISKVVGVKYDDMTPKDVIEAIEKIEKE